MTDPQDEFLPMWAAEPEIDGWPLWSGLPPPAHIAERDALRAELVSIKRYCDVVMAEGTVNERGIAQTVSRMLARPPSPTAQPVQEPEPFAYWAQSVHGRIFSAAPGGMGLQWHPLYAAPVSAEDALVKALEGLESACSAFSSAEVFIPNGHDCEFNFYASWEDVKGAADTVRAALAAKGVA
jgi:hypothetical protein